MIPHQRVYKRVVEILSENPLHRNLWIHLYGEDGGGKKPFIENLLKKSLNQYLLLFRYHAAVFPLESSFHAKKLLKHIFQTHSGYSQKFLHQYSPKLQYLIHRYLQEDRGSETSLFKDELWEIDLLINFLAFVGRERQVMLVLDDVFEQNSPPLRKFITALQQLKPLPALIISTGKAESNISLENGEYHNILIGKLSVRETEQIVADHLQLNAISARLITNHLYIKSEGNSRKIRFLLEAFYRRLYRSEKKLLIESGALRKIRASASVEVIFETLVKELPQATHDIFSFLSRLDDPFPADLFMKILKNYKYGKKELQRWLETGLISSENYLNREFVHISWTPWKEFLRKNTAREHSDAILNFLDSLVDRYQLTYPVELSTQFFEAEYIKTAMSCGYREAILFAKFGKNRRALDRYAFLRRNLSRVSGSSVQKADVLKELGDLQKKVGLYENAFESYRELRECLKRKQRREWIEASLLMADVLFQMDALAEARYLIKDLKIMDSVAEDSLAFADVLMGELEQNSGHPDYALRYYESALSRLPQVEDNRIAIRLYFSLKDIYLGKEHGGKYIQLIRQIEKSLKKDSSLLPYFRLELVKYFIQQGDYEQALPAGISLYRRINSYISPAIASQVRLYLAEIYGYFGKWQLSRSHLRALLKRRLLAPNTRSYIRVLVNSGVVEKELGHYGIALNFLQEAYELCVTNRFARDMYYVKVHLGHIYLLAYSFLRARENLVESLEWAEEQRDEELIILSALFLTSYSLQQNRFELAVQYLEKAGAAIQSVGRQIDKLNYLYYQVMFKLQTGELNEAASLAESLEKESQGIVKFENLSLWLAGKVLMAKGSLDKAKAKLEAALARSLRYRLPYLEFQVLRDLAALAKTREDEPGFREFSTKAHLAFKARLEGIGDEILKRQLEESREYEELLKLGS